MRASTARPAVRIPAAAVSLLLAAALLLASCGPSGGSGDPLVGTVIIRNETDQGMAPLTVTSFFFQPEGVMDPGPNRLAEDLAPGGIVIIGTYTPGLYNGLAILSSGGSLPFQMLVVKGNAPTVVVIPVL